MRILRWPSGKMKKRKKEKATKKKDERMPDFRAIFASLPNIINATIIPENTSTQHAPSAQDRADAKSAEEKKTKAAASKIKIEEVYARLETAKSKNLDIIWLLHTNEDVSFKTLPELIENFRNAQDRDSIEGISVNYVSKGKIREIYPLNEQDLDGLAKKLESNK